jgi:hypothetical protein
MRGKVEAPGNFSAAPPPPEAGARSWSGESFQVIEIEGSRGEGSVGVHPALARLEW